MSAIHNLIRALNKKDLVKARKAAEALQTSPAETRLELVEAEAQRAIDRHAEVVATYEKRLSDAEEGERKVLQELETLRKELNTEQARVKTLENELAVAQITIDDKTRQVEKQSEKIKEFSEIFETMQAKLAKHEVMAEIQERESSDS